MVETNERWRGGIYARVSTDRDSQEHSNEHQISLMENWAKRQGNIEIYDTYIDQGISGTSIKKRYSFQRMLKDAKDGVINLIIVKSVTRFARNQIDSLKLAQELRNIGVRIFFFQENIDTFEDAKMLGLWSWLSENESRQTSERRMLGGREAQKKGKFTTNRPPFGYKSVNGELKINKKESPIVRRIFDLYLEGNGFAKIAGILNEEGYKTRRGFAFKADKIKYMLQNESYKGTFIGNRYTKSDMLSSKIIERPKEDWIILDDHHDPIVSKEEFEQVQQLMQDKSFTVGKRSVSYFAGIIQCGKCGHNYNRTWVKRKNKKGEVYGTYYYYKCSSKKRAGYHICDSKSVREDVLLEIVQREINFLKKNPDVIENIKDQTLTKIKNRINQVDSDLLNIDKRISEIEEQRKTLAKKNITGVIDDDLFIKLDSELKTELKTLNNRKNKTKLVDSIKVFEKRYNDFVDTLMKFDDVTKMSNIELRRLIDKIIITNDEIEIEIKINKDDFELEESLNISPIVSTIDTRFKRIEGGKKPNNTKASIDYKGNVQLTIKYA
ncbi:recombinase family protein [Caldifermentibacillus hisashii]|uniref:Recombinase family protein n=1 Tax=Caldifermentibacillus hisashii TaxID=996558 RepID=A0ABU9K4D8_9BACI